MKRKTVYFLLFLALNFSLIKGQEKLAVLGSSYFNAKTVGIYQEQIEKMGGKVVETFLDGKNPLIFVKYDAGKLNPDVLVERLSNNEFQQPVHYKLVQSKQHLIELGITNLQILSYFDDKKEIEKKEVAFMSEYELEREKRKEAIELKKCDWAPFYYEVTGDPVVDEMNYQKAKEKWVSENPKEYQVIKNQKSN